MNLAPAATEHIRCNLCGADDAETLFVGRDPYAKARVERGASAERSEPRLASPPKYRVARCRSCGLAYQDPRVPEVAIAAHYPTAFYLPRSVGEARGVARLEAAYQRHLFVWEMERVLDAARELGRSPRSVLDVGCGPGQRLLPFRERGLEVAGVEMSGDADLARERFGLDVFRGTLKDYLASGGGRRFELVTACHLVEHLFDPLAELRAVRPLLTDDGLLAIVVPNVGSLQACAFKGRWAPNDLPRHTFFFTPRTLGAMLDAAGFEPVWMSTRMSFLHPPGLAVSLFPGLDPRLTWRGEQEGSRLAGLLRRGLWGAATLGLAPLAWAEGLLGRGGILTVLAAPRH